MNSICSHNLILVIYPRYYSLSNFTAVESNYTFPITKNPAGQVERFVCKGPSESKSKEKLHTTFRYWLVALRSCDEHLNNRISSVSGLSKGNQDNPGPGSQGEPYRERNVHVNSIPTICPHWLHRHA